uniref:Right handed beta helix domain-containing protein n=1 Tax=Amphimedon queenslandica TaxID=400682 RepID=A0A1X7V323_AMPQE
MLILLPLLFLFVHFSLLSASDVKKFYVHPNGNSSLCPTHSTCHTLNEYATLPVPQDSIFYFLPGGSHSLNRSLVFKVDNITFQGVKHVVKGPHETVMEPSVVIQCVVLNKVSIKFIACNSVKLSYITVKNCGTTDLEDYSSIFVINSRYVALYYVSVQRSYAAAVFLDNCSNIQIYNSSFYQNGLCYHSDSPDYVCSYASAIVLRQINEAPSMAFHMAGSNITYNYQLGMHVTLGAFFIPHVEIHLETLCLANNLENLAFVLSYNFDIFINGLVSINSTTGLSLFQTLPVQAGYSQSFTMINTLIANNNVIGIRASLVDVSLHLNSSILSNNLGESSSALNLAAFLPQNSISVVLYNVTFNSNTVARIKEDDEDRLPSFALTALITDIKNVLISDCNFTNNNGTGLGIFNTYATFDGVSNFINNTAFNGGGLYVISDSFVFLTKNSLLRFVNNHATERGGAVNVRKVILVVSSSPSIIPDVTHTEIINQCFYQLPNLKVYNKYFYFESNTAGVSGSVLYGGAPSLCYQGTDNYNTTEFLNISSFNDQLGPSVVSSDSRGVCFCDDEGIYDCSVMQISKSALPGESISFSVAVVGEYASLTTGIISVTSDNGEHSDYNASYAVCTTLTHRVTVTDDETKESEISVTLGSFESNFYQPPLLINVHIRPCLLGTSLSQQSGVCECDDFINSATTSCNSTTAVVTKDGSSWIGSYNNCTTIIYYQYCPYDYCIQSSVNYSLDDPDKQCALNRSGLLCTQCNEGLSLMLGSNKCGECTNDYLSLIIPFSLAGIALVILIIVLNITVTVGTINGLLFFANVVKIFQPILLGTDNTPVLSQFIAWINLDLGIETCFFDGMNVCAKIGLQFVFPFYLWLLILLIIVLSGRFSKLSQLIGNNAVPVLCTLLLLSYTKLLRTVISIFTYANPSSTCTGILWYNNAEPYFTGCHLVLFIIAFAVLLLFIPYTMFLLFFPLWEKCRSKWHFGTKLYLKLKPVFDAYAGPHTDTFRFWPGVLLVARIVLAMSVAIAENPFAFLTAIAFVLIVTLSFGSVYKNKILHSIDTLYLLCLLVIFYSIFTALIQNGQETNLTRLSLSRDRARASVGLGIVYFIALAGFCLTLAYHIYACLYGRCKFTRKEKTVQGEYEEIADHQKDPTTSSLPAMHRPALRESLLESVNNIN